jgi:hypothetical protein
LSARRLELSPSRGLAAAIVSLHLAASAAVLAVLPSLAGALLAAALVALGGIAAWSRALLRSASSVRALELDGMTLRIEDAGGRSVAAQLAERRYVGPRGVVLVLRQPMKRTILVTAAMLDPQAFRALRLWTLWGRLCPGKRAPRVAGKQLAA